MYIIYHPQKACYFSSGESEYVNRLGYCLTPAWVPRSGLAWSTSSYSLARQVAAQYGGTVLNYP
ncbi:hypothetical protein [Kamptonema sp. UHCC 0994]|uniref:hypothetical protein n=1 Tax=Kamptonema sp. UHCC 0994 TaxID=3031329 RepID=UPI0023B941EC|nr:hypothetical protein [Kamptonema sp. UHCC 0994]MDF0553148.1 hypothetical protein [Kamptonema sp. UHCC 0994]